MSKIRIISLLIVGALTISSKSFAGKKPTDEERKVIANKEYALCMEIAKENGVPAVLTYIMNAQRGTSLKGNSEKLAQENCAADAMGLTRFQDLEEIIDNDKGELSPIISPLIHIKDDVPQARHVARPWVRDYLFEISSYLEQEEETRKVGDHNAQIVVASLVRSREDQNMISRVSKVFRYIKGKLRGYIKGKSSFAGCSSKAVCSTHLTGSTVDISLLGANRVKRKLLRERLLKDRDEGRILVILENAGNHFHVFIIPPLYAGQTKTPAKHDLYPKKWTLNKCPLFLLVELIS